MTKQEFLKKEKEVLLRECYKTGVAVHISREYRCTHCDYKTKSPGQIYDHICDIK